MRYTSTWKNKGYGKIKAMESCCCFSYGHGYILGTNLEVCHLLCSPESQWPYLGLPATTKQSYLSHSIA